MIKRELSPAQITSLKKIGFGAYREFCYTLDDLIETQINNSNQNLTIKHDKDGYSIVSIENQKVYKSKEMIDVLYQLLYDNVLNNNELHKNTQPE